ncbi:MAG TPA: glycoside hydrolase family 25 protein [Bradyrhizobium sp.]|nr:glycoside hydrolase family 25 protein [Bradyrhizobium sp.]
MAYDGIFDMSHWQGTPDLANAKAAGFAAVIIKATEGTTIADRNFLANLAGATRNGFLTGAYHFGEPGNGIVQADFFLSTVNPTPRTLVALDFERSSSGTMTIQAAVDFVTHIKEQLGRWPVLYGGATLKEQLNHQPNMILSNCPLWLAQYATTAVLPPGWQQWTLWQFSDDNSNKPENPVPGVSPVDRDGFNGTAEELAARWPL